MNRVMVLVTSLFLSGCGGAIIGNPLKSVAGKNSTNRVNISTAALTYSDAAPENTFLPLPPHQQGNDFLAPAPRTSHDEQAITKLHLCVTTIYFASVETVYSKIIEDPQILEFGELQNSFRSVYLPEISFEKIILGMGDACGTGWSVRLDPVYFGISIEDESRVYRRPFQLLFEGEARVPPHTEILLDAHNTFFSLVNHWDGSWESFLDALRTSGTDRFFAF